MVTTLNGIFTNDINNDYYKLINNWRDKIIRRNMIENIIKRNWNEKEQFSFHFYSALEPLF